MENNRLIAEFMGATIDSDGNVKFIVPADGKGIAGIALGACRYSTSWDWLMPVVEKIEKVNHVYFDIYREATIVRYQPQDTTLWKAKCNDENDKINHVYNAVLKFIEWYKSDWYNSQPHA